MPDDTPTRPVALVTGAGTGIGAATATTLLTAGYNVAGLYNHHKPADDVLAIQADITDTDQLTEAFNTVQTQLGPVSVLVAAAGINDDRLLVQMSEDQFLNVLNTNLVSAYRLAKLAIRPMIKARHGRIILVSSVGALIGVTGQTNYAAAKAGLVGFARSLAREVASRGITVNVIAPGWTETDMVSHLTEDQRNQAIAEVPVGRFADPAEIAQAALFLADAPYITGAVLPVDGGAGMGL